FSTSFKQLMSMSATVYRNADNIFGLIEGYDEEEQSLIFTILEDSSRDIKEYDLFVPSSMGGMYPSGLPIGKVTEVLPDDYGLTKTAYVKPEANMYDINQVIVVNRKLDTVKEDE